MAVLKTPPTSIRPPLAATTETDPFTAGFQAVAEPVIASTTTILEAEDWPPAAMKFPPIATCAPIPTSAFTMAFGCGSHPFSEPLEREAAYDRSVPPTSVNSPPKYKRPPVVAKAHTGAFGSGT